MTKFARAKISSMLTFKSVEHSKVYSFQLEFAQQQWKYSSQLGQWMSAELWGKKTHVFKFWFILTVRMTLVSCEKRVNIDHYLPRMCMWPNEHLEQILQKCVAVTAGCVMLTVMQSSWAHCLAREHEVCLAKNTQPRKQRHEDLVRVVCKQKLFKLCCVKLGGETVQVTHPSTASSWAEPESEQALLQEEACLPAVCFCWFWSFLFVWNGFCLFV